MCVSVGLKALRSSELEEVARLLVSYRTLAVLGPATPD